MRFVDNLIKYPLEILHGGIKIYTYDYLPIFTNDALLSNLSKIINQLGFDTNHDFVN